MRPLKKKQAKIGFKDRLSLKAGHKYCRMLQESILQYFRAALSYHLFLRPLFCPFKSGRSRQALLESENCKSRLSMYTLLQHRRVLLLSDKHVHFIAASAGLTVKR